MPSKKKNKMDKTDWAIGGCLLAGIGVGFIFLLQSALIFIACVLIGLGVGIVLSSIISSFRK